MIENEEKNTLAISIGDLNGIGIEIALKAHEEVCTLAKPLYCISENMLTQACEKLGIQRPKNFELAPVGEDFEIKPSKINKKSGAYSYNSFIKAIKLCEAQVADALVTLPIHKEAWYKADLSYKGHTDLLREYFDKEAIMMLGCKKMYVALFTEHVSLKEVPALIKKESLYQFLVDFSREVSTKKIAVLGLNPHAGDGGVLGEEDKLIKKVIKKVNYALGEKRFVGPFVPDTAFTKPMRKKYKTYVAMYHDQGLIPLKSLYFEESINVSLNLPIVRTSVDHGTAFDIAYKSKSPSTLSYLNAIKEALTLSQKRKEKALFLA